MVMLTSYKKGEKIGIKLNYNKEGNLEKVYLKKSTKTKWKVKSKDFNATKDQSK